MDSNEEEQDEGREQIKSLARMSFNHGESWLYVPPNCNPLVMHTIFV